MKQPLVLSIFILLFAITCLGQDNLQSTIPQAQKFDEFEFLAKDDRERAARFAEGLTKSPTARGYIIVYQERVSGFCGPVGVGSAIWFLRNMIERYLESQNLAGKISILIITEPKTNVFLFYIQQEIVILNRVMAGTFLKGKLYIFPSNLLSN